MQEDHDIRPAPTSTQGLGVLLRATAVLIGTVLLVFAKDGPPAAVLVHAADAQVLVAAQMAQDRHPEQPDLSGLAVH